MSDLPSLKVKYHAFQQSRRWKRLSVLHKTSYVRSVANTEESDTTCRPRCTWCRHSWCQSCYVTRQLRFPSAHVTFAVISFSISGVIREDSNQKKTTGWKVSFRRNLIICVSPVDIVMRIDIEGTRPLHPGTTLWRNGGKPAGNWIHNNITA